MGYDANPHEICTDNVVVQCGCLFIVVQRRLKIAVEFNLKSSVAMLLVCVLVHETRYCQWYIEGM